MTWLYVFLGAASSLRPEVQLFPLSFSSSRRSNLISRRQHYHVRAPAWDRAYHFPWFAICTTRDHDARRNVCRLETPIVRIQSTPKDRYSTYVTVSVESLSLSFDKLGDWANNNRDFARRETREGCALVYINHLTNLSDAFSCLAPKITLIGSEQRN